MKTFKYLKVMALAIGLLASGCEDDFFLKTGDDDEDDIIVDPLPTNPDPDPPVPYDSIPQ